MVVFLAVSAAGVYALGNGLRAVFQPDRGIDLAWLAVAVAAIWILFSQMGRVHDSWPRRPSAGRHPGPVVEANTARKQTALSATADHLEEDP